MLRWLFWLLFLYPLPAKAVGPDTLRLSRFTQFSYLYRYATVTETSLLASLRTETNHAHAQLLTSQTPTRADRAYWLRCTLLNDSDSTKTLFVYTSTVQSATFFIHRPNCIDTLQAGTMTATNDWSTDENDQYVRFVIEPHELLTLTIRLANKQSLLTKYVDMDYPAVSLQVLLEQENFHYQRRYAEVQRNSPEFLYRSGVQGALVFFSLFVGLLYSRYRQRLYLYYWLYVLAACLFALLKTRTYTPLGHWLSYAPLFRTHLPESIMWLGLGTYLFFIIELLDLPQQHPKATRWLKRLAWASATYGILYGLFMLLTNNQEISQLLFWRTRILLIPVYVGVLVWMNYQVRSPLVRYVVAGNALMALVGILAWLRAGEVLLKGIKLPGNIDDLMTVSFAVLLEILVFALAVARRIQQLDTERELSQQAYISQLDANRILMIQLNEELAIQVEQKTAETLEAFRQLENQRMNQVRSDYEKRIAEIEMLALRSQMNPHFLFNSLNTLEYFILSGNEQKASAYLSTFSRLLRTILNHSREEAITLADELAMLKLYIDIEAPRFGNEFYYSIQVDPAIPLQQILIPPMLLQPFVENAIWHGLLQSQRTQKQLTVDIRADVDQTLRIDIIDNGIGREKAAQLKRRSSLQRKSVGLDIMQQRLDLFNTTYSSQIRIDWTDQPNGEGTIVQISYRMPDKKTETDARYSH